MPTCRGFVDVGGSMTRRLLLCGGLLAFMISGWVGSAPAAPNRSGELRSPRARVVRVSLHARHRHRASLESLSLPRSMSMTGPTQVSAASAILMDAVTGEVLFEQNADEPRPPASITKILTALVILERGVLADTVVVSQAAASVGGYRLGLRRGQRVSLEDLLSAVLIRSANDAAEAAAEHVGSGLAGFVAMMNAKAQELGMFHSHFENPHGLDEPGHYTTARDMALLTRVAMAHPYFAQLVRTRETTVTIWQPGPRGLQGRVRTILSHNKLLGRLEGADGVKTGYTDAAGRCLVASASRGGQRMIAVLLKDSQRWSDAATLLEFGFGAATGAVLPVSEPSHAAGAAGGHS
jgi:D-alanyl-D-alanine carboxypeptidase (penicillin-binding protein 5/6)